MDIIIITEATPITVPNIVKKLWILFFRREADAILIDCIKVFNTLLKMNYKNCFNFI